MYPIQAYKRSHKIWFFSFILSNFLVFALILIVNPYRLLPFSVTIPHLNDIKPKLYDYQRYVKLFDIAHQKPKTILLGSSRILWGVDPKNSLLQQKDYMPVYNAGVLGPPMYEVRKYFDHALVSQPHLKRVILGIDFFTFNHIFDGRSFVTENSFGKNTKELLKANARFIFDLKAVLLTLKSSLLHQQTMSLREDGRVTPDPTKERKVYKNFFSQVTEKRALAEKNNQQSAPDTRNQIKNVLYDDFKISEADMDAIRYIVKTCHERHIELYLFFTPVSELDAYHQLGIWKDYKTLMRELARIHPFWNFVSWNEVTRNRENYTDGSHFIFSVGDMIIKKMFYVKDPTIPKTFGRYVTANNVEHALQELEEEYEQSQNLINRKA